MSKPTYEYLEAQVKQLEADNEKAMSVLKEANDAVLLAKSKFEALAAENAAMKDGRKFYMYSDDSGFETFETQEEAIKAAQEMIDACREDAYDGWPEAADTISWGVVIQQATETDFKKPAPENGWVGSSDYKLLPETPATYAFLAEVRAQVWVEGNEPTEFGRYWVRYETDVGPQYCSALWMEYNFCAGSDTNIHKIWLADHSRSINSLRGVTHYTKLPDSLEGATA